MIRSEARRILLIGQCTLHWGRMEFGNLGNYAIIEPLVRELHRVFPRAEIRTTFQMSDDFCERESVTRLPMQWYYAWRQRDLWISLYECLASFLKRFLSLTLPPTPFMMDVSGADMVIDYSGDMWGENAGLAGKNRFIIGGAKDLTSHWLRKPTVLLAGSPGPFRGWCSKSIARFVLRRFDLITNREEISTRLLEGMGIGNTDMKTTACPAFLFGARPASEMQEVFAREKIRIPTAPTAGFIVCGWNMPQGPFSRWPREDWEFEAFAEVIEHMNSTLGIRVCLLSHNNGFVPPPDFQVTPGRDHQVLTQLMTVLRARGKASNFFQLQGVYNAAETKSIIGKFDMLVSGRVHGAVAAMSQCVPTVIIDYGHEPKAHKLRGFAQIMGVADFVADPNNVNDMIAKITRCWHERDSVRAYLTQRLPDVLQRARSNFDLLPELL